MPVYILRERPVYSAGATAGVKLYTSDINQALLFNTMEEAAEFISVHNLHQFQILPQLHAFNQHLETKRMIEYDTDF